MWHPQNVAICHHLKEQETNLLSITFDTTQSHLQIHIFANNEMIQNKTKKKVMFCILMTRF